MRDAVSNSVAVPVLAGIVFLSKYLIIFARYALALCINQVGYKLLSCKLFLSLGV